MVLPTIERRTMFSSRQKIVFLVVMLIVGCIFTTYHPLFSNSPRNYIKGRYKTQPITRLETSENLNLAFVKENMRTLDQTDPQLIQYTRVRHLTPPSKQPYNLGDAANLGPDGFAQLISNLFNKKRNGVFIEAGANDGGETSHTLYLEKELGWSGLLVECNPKVIPDLRTKHRKAWIADVCLSPSGHAETLNFSYPTHQSFSGTLGKPWNLKSGSDPAKWNYIDVQAIPLYTLLAGLGWTEVDYFLFDVEGQELAILRNFPFDLFRFKVLVFEEQFTSKEERLELEALLKKNGYVYLKSMEVDKVYVHGEFYGEMESAVMKAA